MQQETKEISRDLPESEKSPLSNTNQSIKKKKNRKHAQPTQLDRQQTYIQ